MNYNYELPNINIESEISKKVVTPEPIVQTVVPVINPEIKDADVPKQKTFFNKLTDFIKSLFTKKVITFIIITIIIAILIYYIIYRNRQIQNENDENKAAEHIPPGRIAMYVEDRISQFDFEKYSQIDDISFGSEFNKVINEKINNKDNENKNNKDISKLENKKNK